MGILTILMEWHRYQERPDEFEYYTGAGVMRDEAFRAPFQWYAWDDNGRCLRDDRGYIRTFATHIGAIMALEED